MSFDSVKAPTLLVIDDDPHVLAVVDRFASELGFTVVQETNGQAALRSLPVTKPDGAIIDVGLCRHRRPQPSCGRSRPRIRSRR